MPTTARPGRPRSTAAQAAILRATVEQIRETGYDAASMEAIAERAGVGKATLYRHWPNKEALAIEAIGAIVRLIQAPDTGSVRADLRGVLHSTSMLYRDPRTRGLLSGLISAMARSVDIAEAVASRISNPRRAALRAVLRRAVVRRELRRDTRVEIVVDLLSGAFLMRSLVTGARIDDPLIEQMLDVVLDGTLSLDAA